MNDLKKEKKIEIEDNVKLYGTLDNNARCKLCYEKNYRFIVYLCLKCDARKFFCFDCLIEHNVRQYTCLRCTGSNYMIDISKWYRDNAEVFCIFNGEIICRREIEPLKCDRCESFYYYNTSYRCECGNVFKRYCADCCEKNEINVKACSECDNGFDTYLVSVFYKRGFNKHDVH